MSELNKQSNQTNTYEPLANSTFVNAAEYSDFDEFAKEVGLIDDLEELKAINAPVPYHENGMYETDDEQCSQLINFLQRETDYHLCTVTSDSDGEEADELESIWFELNPTATQTEFEEFSEDEMLWEKFQEEFPVSLYTIDNCTRFVNRIGYYICKGNDDSSISLTELSRMFPDEKLQNFNN